MVIYYKYMIYNIKVSAITFYINTGLMLLPISTWSCAIPEFTRIYILSRRTFDGIGYNVITHKYKSHEPCDKTDLLGVLRFCTFMVSYYHL